MGDRHELYTLAQARVGRLVNGKFRLLRLLGVGGTASVYEASHRNGKRVALKLLHASLGASPRQRKRFLREAYVANTVAHPGVVQIYDDGLDDDGTAFLVLELLSGRTAGALAREHAGKLPLERVLDLGDQVLDVLAAAHARGVVHRDIKPDNLFVTDDGLVKVLDFGVARLFEHIPGATIQTRDGSMLGTPAFMAQEQARGRWDEVDARTDLWALGATLFTLCSDQLVHHADTANEQLGKAMSMPARSLGSLDLELPERFVATVDRALAFDREARFADAASMQAALRGCFSDALLASREQRELERSKPPEPSISDLHSVHPSTDGRNPQSLHNMWRVTSHASSSTQHTARMRVLALLGLALLTTLAIQQSANAPRERRPLLAAASTQNAASAHARAEASATHTTADANPSSERQSTADAAGTSPLSHTAQAVEALTTSSRSALHVAVRPTASRHREPTLPELRHQEPRPPPKVERTPTATLLRAEHERSRHLPTDPRATWPDPLDRRH